MVARKNARVGQDRSRPTFLRLTVERPRRRSSTSSLSLPNEKMCIRVNCFVLVATVAAGNAVFADDGSDLFKPVRLVLQQHCSECHSEAAKKNDELQGGLLLDSFDSGEAVRACKLRCCISRLALSN